MVEITNINVTGSFRYLWLKYVNGVNLKVHCAKSLLGTYSKKVSPQMGHVQEPITLDEAQGDVFYLCGVTKPYRWINNFHLAFKEKEGSTIHVNRNGIDITIRNAVEIPITDKYINQMDSNAHKKEYCTCRNWQFAYMYATGHLDEK